MSVVLKVLIACEESQTVCKAFRELGHEAYSCDILPTSGGHPEWHINEDVSILLKERNIAFYTQDGEIHGVDKWDLMIGHPSCVFLTVTANKWMKPEFANRFPNRPQQREDAVDFFMKLMNAPINHIAIENPIGIMSTRFRKPNQIIQPWQFGHETTKSTCLWLKNLPLLIPTNIVDKGETVLYKSGNRMSKWYADAAKLSKEERSRVRSITFSGIAKAMAEQYSDYLINKVKLEVN